MYHKTVLDNGIRIISEQLDHMKSVSLGIWVDVGSRDEKESENGISHFIEHMIFKGTRNRTSFQIAKELDAIGGLSNAFTGKENTCFHARVLGKHFGILADILADIFLNSVFDPEDLERERQVIFQEISMVEDTPDDNIHVLFNRFFWMGHPVGFPILGTIETVSTINKGTILKHINDFYVPEKIVVAAAGSVDHQTLVSYFRPLLEPLNRGNSMHNRTIPPSNGGVYINNKELEQVHICLGGEAPSLLSKKRFACAILNTILGGNMSSRLFQEIRENQGLAYSVYSFLSAYFDTGLLGVYVATDPANVNPVLSTIQKEIRKISSGDLSESDLSAAKEHLIGGIYLSSESTDGRMMRIVKNEMNFNRYIEYEELVAYLEEVKVDEVIEMSNSIFKEGKVSITTLGPLEEAGVDMETLRF
ncbi:Peptidase M16 inactive domain protein [uncultured Desulfobacterium sp.]|uniref:Peptidase M16 inactive domain protein n=1 Tax=uncultured Desulfobacterium sp. TaxID=201089 RepID=A0A445MZN5_9BACT|nr:Peptidase M16 inactive domain protein [uncultured Desulfobacterium sp.]